MPSAAFPALLTLNYRDGDWACYNDVACRMGKLYRFLGISVSVVQEGQSQSRKRAAFNADITYLTANSLGFTFLGDTSAVEKKEDLVNRSACQTLLKDAR